MIYFVSTCNQMVVEIENEFK